MNIEDLNWEVLYHICRECNTNIMVVDFFGAIRVYGVMNYQPPSKSNTSPINYMTAKVKDITNFVKTNTTLSGSNNNTLRNLFLKQIESIDAVDFKFSDEIKWVFLS